MILSDFDLRNYIRSGRLIIQPFEPSTIRENGVDLRLGGEVAHLHNLDKLVDTRKGDLNLQIFYSIERGDEFVIKAHEKVLLTTLERIKLPGDIMAFVELRSSFARLGLMIPPTIIDAGFEGNITLEVEGSSFPIKIYKGERFAHIIFAKTLNPVERPYRGRYQGQTGVTLPKLIDL